MTIEATATESSSTSTESLNAALAEIGDGPIPEGAQEGSAQQEPQPAQPQWNGEEWKFSWNGKEIVPQSRENLIQWANQGYNYSQRMGELNKTHAQRMAEIEQEKAKAREIESRYKPFAEVDEYARNNPDWWQHVQQSFKTREQQGLDPKLREVIAPLQEKLTAMEQEALERRQAEEAARVAEVQAKEDQALDDEIGAIRKQHPNIDLSARDASGETLERRILLHAQENGINSFRAAFRDYLHDQLVVQKGAETKQQAVKQQQQQAKAGLLGKTSAPVRELKRANGRMGWNHPELSVEAALAEWNSTNHGG